MNCPRCHHQLTELEKEGILLDFCSNCHGILFDQHELAQSLKSSLSLLDQGDYIPIKRGAIRMKATSELGCPRCSKKMREFNYGYTEGGEIQSTDIIINSCLDCSIVWLDAGEFEAIKAARGIAPTPDFEAISTPSSEKKHSRQCPNCTVALKEVRKNGVNLDYCDTCWGIWLDQRELQALLKKPPHTPNTSRPAAPENESDRVCPVCKIGLYKHPYHIDVQVMVDSCLKCNGVWLDRGEFDQIVKSVQGPLTKRLSQLRSSSELLW